MFAPSKKLVAFFLAGLYALVAAFGHTMHSGCCTSFESTAACSHACCDKVDTGRFDMARAALASLRSQPTSTPAHAVIVTETLGKVSDLGVTHGICATCQLLSQMSHGFAVDAPHAGAWLNTSYPPVINESLTECVTVSLFDARGPPARS